MPLNRWSAASSLPGLHGFVLLCCLFTAGVVLAADTGERPTPLQAHTVMADGHPLRVWQKSASAAEAVMLLVHGRTWSTRPDFDLQVAGEDKSLMDGLTQRGITVYGVDLRGYGETPRDASGWLTPDRAVQDVIQVLEWINARHGALPAAYLFGWSYGSTVAQLVAQRAPGALSGIVLFGYPVRPGYAQTPPELTGAPPRHPTTAAAAASDFIVPGSISSQAVEAFVEQALAADPVRADWRNLEQWQQLDAAAVDVPVLLLEGEFDPLAIDTVQAELFTRLATSDKAWVLIPGGDHAAFLETPRDYFLSQLETFVLRR